MTVKLSTTINNIKRDVINSENRQLLVQFFDFMKRAGTSEKYQNNNLKALIGYSKFLGPTVSFFEVENKIQVISCLDTKIKNSENDPDKRWITTWNDYLIRIKYFFRWMYNCKDKDLDDVPFLDWVTPDFVKINSTTITNLLSDVLEQLQSMAVMAIC
jgi:integrase/recombinase XerD